MREPSPPEKLASMIVGLKAAGLTAAEIARETKVSRQTIWRFEQGDCRLPSYALYERVELLFQQRCMGGK